MGDRLDQMFNHLMARIEGIEKTLDQLKRDVDYLQYNKVPDAEREVNRVQDSLRNLEHQVSGLRYR